MIYKSKFFRTEPEARLFQEQNGRGALYILSDLSPTKSSYLAEAAMSEMSEMSEKYMKEHPFCVAWNEK